MSLNAPCDEDEGSSQSSFSPDDYVDVTDPEFIKRRRNNLETYYRLKNKKMPKRLKPVTKEFIPLKREVVKKRVLYTLSLLGDS